MKNILFILIFSAVGCTSKNENKTSAKENDVVKKNILTPNFTGNWIDGNKNGTDNFTVNIIKKEDIFWASYCAISDNGQKVDCPVNDSDNLFSFKVSDTNAVITEFSTNFSSTDGKVKLTLKNDTLYWEIIEMPQGEYYCPKKALLIKS